MAGLGPAIHDSGATGPPGKNHPTHRLRCDTLRGLAAMQVAELPDAPQKSKGHTGLRSLEDNALLLLVFAISLAFACILWTFFGALLWAACWQSCSRRCMSGCCTPCRSGKTFPLSPRS